MENEDGLFKWLAATFRAGYEECTRFWCVFYGGEAAARAAEIEALERAYAASPDTPERTP